VKRFNGFHQAAQVGQESLPKPESPLVEVLLGTHKCSSSLRVFDRHRFDTPGTQIVGAAGHVQVSDIQGELEGVQNQVRPDPWRPFEGPPIHVHVGMQASGLLLLCHPGSGQRSGIERTRGVGEESEGVKVRTTQPLGVHGSRYLVRFDAQWDGPMADRIGPVQHGPFVQAKTPESRRAILCGCQHIHHPPGCFNEPLPGGSDRGRARQLDHPVIERYISVPGIELGRIRPTQKNTHSRVPFGEPDGTEPVVLEQEVSHRIGLMPGPALHMRSDEDVVPFLKRVAPFHPVCSIQRRVHDGSRYVGRSDHTRGAGWGMVFSNGP
jgi:hypothetical protein